MKIQSIILIAIALSGNAPAADPVYDWARLRASNSLANSEVITAGEESWLKIVHTNGPAQIPLLRLDAPPVTEMQYGLIGEIRYTNVTGEAYLEMWSHFDGGAAYFTRTLGEGGPMGKITGSSGWRTASLPFQRSGAVNPPLRLEVNLVLQGPGTFELKPFRLVQGFNAFVGGTFRASEHWWSSRVGGIIGGLGGTFLGVFASILALLASKGLARTFVLGATRLLIGLGICCLAIGVLALLRHQPWHVWYVFALLGILLVLIIPSRRREFARQYDELELRRIASADLRAPL